jgi:acetyl-CoA synthetase
LFLNILAEGEIFAMQSEMHRDLSRLFQPKSIAVVGGGAWCRQIVRQLQQAGFQGAVHVVHPTVGDIHGVRVVRRCADLPDPPDAAFVGVNRIATIAVVRELADMGAGGAVCFASGFSEAMAEDGTGPDLQAQLVQAAGQMPILGPNCYGFINAMEGVLLWPDQHGCGPVDRGVAIVTQSSNIAINLTMQRRGLPIAFVATCGNMAQTSQADIVMALLDDSRITAIGVHVEGFGDPQAWHALAIKAAARRVPIIALKVGASEQAQLATVSHTASMAGGDAGASALLRRLGIARLHDLPSFLETLKLLHCAGPLDSAALSSISCSGGEASLIADTALGRRLEFPALLPDQREALADALGPMVALSNPLDYHTYIWGDAEKMTAAWLPMAASHIGLTLIIVDYPHTDPTDWEAATQAALAVRARSGRPVGVVSTLPELMPPDVSTQLLAGGVVPFGGLVEALNAAEAAAGWVAPPGQAPLCPGPARHSVVWTEAEAKAVLAGFGVPVPKGAGCTDPAQLAVAALELRAPLVLKGMGLAHKSEAGAVQLGLAAKDLAQAAQDMQAPSYLVEEMVQAGVAELLVAVTRDAAHGFVLTLGAGGVLTELWRDTVSLLLPVTSHDITQALAQLRIYPLLGGYRGRPAANMNAIADAVLALQECVVEHAARIEEIEINPLICTPEDAVAVDALLTMAPADAAKQGGTEGLEHGPDQNET